ncbi:SH3 domain-containing protein [Amycolatopsis suaedae]|uniref:SH3 domain-containing protein n=1 Tax=Amycolatopsis suaedae TaxID=2510978 RepID=A0A4Q7J4L4_9PSEU|nr:hypothetical protein [Amycolatopsis suaedae]RZQ61979.1 hypothetical protein EWH70_20450 [Amycolatopsis suaedae]
MFVALRLGLVIRILAVAALLVGVLVLLLVGAQSSPGASPRQTPVAPPVDVRAEQPSAVEFPVARSASDGLNIRECAAVTCRKSGVLRPGDSFTGQCWVRGGEVDGDNLWLRGESGYVSAHFLDDPVGAFFNDKTAAVPACDSMARSGETLAVG